MNILIVAKEDFSGAGNALMEAINDCTEHKAHQIAYRRMGLNYPVEIVKPTAEELAEWIAWADVVNLHAGPPAQLRAMGGWWRGKGVVWTYHGSWYRSPVRRRAQTDASCQSHGWVQTALINELASYGPRWIGRAIPDLSYMHDPRKDAFVVNQAVTKDVRRKGADMTAQALEGSEGIAFDLVTKVNNAESLRRKGQAHLTVDQGPAEGMQGHGTTSLESWAMGMPVVSCPDRWIHEAVLEHAGYSPYYYVEPDLGKFRAAIARFRDSYLGDRAFYDHWRDEGRRYLAQYHAPEVVARKSVEAFEESLAKANVRR